MAPDAAEAVFPPDARARLADLCDLAPEVLDDLTTARARAVLADAEVLVTGWGCPPLDAAALAAAPRLRAVVHAAGTVRGHVTEACWERGLRVSSAAAANALPVAEYTLAMILLGGKRALESARDYRATRRRSGGWRAAEDVGNHGRTVGVLSASLIGRRVVELLRPHDLRVLLHDPLVPAAEVTALGAEPVGLAELFARADVLTVHTPLLPTTRGLVSRELLGRLRTGALLINTARGAVLDQAALTEEVTAGRLRAVLDVTDPEVLPPDHPLWECENVLITPHLAGSQGNELRRLADTAVDEVARWTVGEEFAHPVRPERRALLA